MIYYLSLYLKQYFTWLNAFHYVSFRAMAALLTALVVSFVFGTRFIAASKKWFRAKARVFAPATHKAKDNMPTMGGIFILATVLFSCLLWCNITSWRVIAVMLSLVTFGAIGFWDDWCKIRYGIGISARKKFSLQLIAATTIVTFIYAQDFSTQLCVPLFKSWNPSLGMLFIPWAVFVVLAMSNSVNFTDGLDGLAIGSLILNFCTFAIIGFLAGHVTIAHYLHIPFAGSCEIAVIGGALVGASIGFLWYNAYPAQIFMGDVGSLALGAALALMALLSKQELLLPLAGGLFVLEVVSVILQVASVKLYGKRLFKMAPIHHHFELIGWPEAKITTRFGIITLILCLIALMVIKVR